MFAIEIEFGDGLSPSETILVRRANAVFGSSDLADVIIEGASSANCELRVVREIGRRFRIEPVYRNGREKAGNITEKKFDGYGVVELGDVELSITALDIDLGMSSDEVPDKVSKRVLSRALTSGSPSFPAVVVVGAIPVCTSFSANQSVIIGRSRSCGVRLNSSDVSAEHAMVGIDKKGAWVEDYGSTNGTFVNNERISGRRYFTDKDSFQVGSEFLLKVFLEEDDYKNFSFSSIEVPKVKDYPVILAFDSDGKPIKISLKTGKSLTIGRDPTNDIWLNVPHVSRTHIEIENEDGLKIRDLSSNGTFINGDALPRGEFVPLNKEFALIDFSSGTAVGICYSKEDEEQFSSLIEGKKASAESKGVVLETSNLPAIGAAKETDSEDLGKMKEENSGKTIDAKVNNDSSIHLESASEYQEHLVEELSEFEQYQSRMRSSGSSLLDTDADYRLLEEEFGEEFLDSREFSGFGKKFLILFIVGLVVLSLLLCMLAFNKSFY